MPAGRQQLTGNYSQHTQSPQILKQPITLPFYARLALILISIIAVGYLGILGQTILAPFILGLLFAIMLLPLANLLEKKCRFPRSLSSAVSVFSMIIVVSVVVYFIGTQLSFLVSAWPHLEAQLTESFSSLQQWVHHTFHIEVSKQLSYLSSLTSKAMSASTSMVTGLLVSFSGLLLFFIFTLLYTFFILVHRKRLVQFLVSSFSTEHSNVVFAIVEQTQYMVKKYITGLLTEMFAVFCLSGILLWIVGSKFVLLLALITGIFNVIPYIGIFTALLLSAVITFATATAVKALFAGLAILLVHLIDSNVLMPVILGSKVRINALVIIIGVIVGEMLWGISGMFVAIPIIAIMKIIFDNVDSLRPWAILLGDEEKDMTKKKSILARLKLRMTLNKQKKNAAS